MKLLKTIILIVLIFACCYDLPAKKRVSGLSMKDLTDPSSPSYVPFPYPKTREEIIEDLKYQVSKMYSQKNRWEHSISEVINLFPELIKENSSVKIGEIVKVKNRMSTMAKSYSYLIFLSDAQEKYISRVAMKACGILSGGVHPSKENPGKKLISYDKALEKLANHLGNSYKKEKVKKIERMALHIIFAPPSYPTVEMTLTDGSVYYLNYNDHLYKKTSEKPLIGDEHSALKAETKRKKGEWVLIDSIKDTICHLEQVD